MSRGTILILIFFALSVGLLLPTAKSQSKLTFTPINVSGATRTEANGVVQGEVVGFYVDSAQMEHGFKESSGKVTTIDFPGATGTRAYSMDLNFIFIAGTYTDSKMKVHGFRLDNGGNFTSIDVPGAAWTRAFSINSMGTIAGAYADSAGTVHGFLDKNGGGTFTTLDFPGSKHTEIHSIVNLRYMAGIYFDAAGAEHGVQGAAGQLGGSINVPGAALTTADGVNNAVEIVGHFGASTSGPFHGYFLSGGQFETINFPGATDTRCNGVDDELEIVGSYTDVAGLVHGFIAK